MLVLLLWINKLIVPLKYFRKVPCYQLRSLWWSWTCLFRFCCLWASHLTLGLFPPLGSGADNTHPNYLTGTLRKSWDDRCESTFWTTKCNPHWKIIMTLIPLLWLTSPSHLQSSPAPSSCSNLSWVQGLAFQELSPGSWIGSFPSNSAFARCPNGSPRYLSIGHTERLSSGVFMAQANLHGIPAVALAVWETSCRPPSISKSHLQNGDDKDSCWEE